MNRVFAVCEVRVVSSRTRSTPNWVLVLSCQGVLVAVGLGSGGRPVSPLRNRSARGGWRWPWMLRALRRVAEVVSVPLVLSSAALAGLHRSCCSGSRAAGVKECRYVTAVLPTPAAKGGCLNQIVRSQRTLFGESTRMREASRRRVPSEQYRGGRLFINDVNTKI